VEKFRGERDNAETRSALRSAEDLGFVIGRRAAGVRSGRI
jgi:hypothetical protein